MAELPHFEKLASFKTASTRRSVYTAPVSPKRRTIQNKYSKQEASSFFQECGMSQDRPATVEKLLQELFLSWANVKLLH